MTPSRPAPSKRRNQSSATARSRGRRRQVERRRGVREDALEPRAALGERRVAQVAVALREQIEEDDRGRDLAREQLRRATRPDGGAAAAPRSRGAPSRAMTISPSSTQRGGSCACSGAKQLGEVAVERLLVAALDEDLVAVAEHERAKPVPLRLEDPVAGVRQRADPQGEHGRDGEGDRWQHDRTLTDQRRDHRR